MYSFVITNWTQTEGFGNFTVNTFGASTSFKALDFHFFLTHADVSEQFTPGVWSTKAWRPQVTNLYSHGLDKRHPTAEMKILLPSSWVAKETLDPCEASDMERKLHVVAAIVQRHGR